MRGNVIKKEMNAICIWKDFAHKRRLQVISILILKRRRWSIPCYVRVKVTPPPPHTHTPGYRWGLVLIACKKRQMPHHTGQEITWMKWKWNENEMKMKWKWNENEMKWNEMKWNWRCSWWVCNWVIHKTAELDFKSNFKNTIFRYSSPVNYKKQFKALHSRVRDRRRREPLGGTRGMLP